MPTIAAALPQANTIDTVVDQVSKQLVSYLGLVPETKIHKVADDTRRVTPEGKIEERDNSMYFSTQQTSELLVRYSERFTDDSTMSNTLYGMEYPDLWSLPRLGLRFRSAYATTIVELQCTISVMSRSELARIRRAAHMAATQRYPLYSHRVAYELDVPDAYTHLFFTIWESQERKDGYGHSFNSFLIEGTKIGRPGARQTQNGKFIDLYLRVDEVDILGRMSSERYFEEKARNDDRHELTFTYQLEFNQPIGSVLTYPLFVHQQRLPKEYIEAWAPSLKSYTVEAEQYSTSLHKKPITNPRFYQADGGVHLDVFDEWFPKPPAAGTRTLALAPILVNQADPHAVVNLRDFIPDISESIVEYSVSNPTKFNIHTHFPYGMELWSVGADESRVTCTMDANGDIRTLYPMENRLRHYLRIYYLADLSLLVEDTVPDLLYDLPRLQELVRLTDPTFTVLDPDGVPVPPASYDRHGNPLTGVTEDGNGNKVIGPSVPTVGGKTIAPEEWRKLVKDLVPTAPEYKRHDAGHQRHIQQIGITAYRR